MEVFIILLMLVFIYEILGELLPLLFQGMAAAIRYLGACLITATGILLKAAFKGVIWLGKNTVPAAQFLYFLIDELLRGPHIEASEEEPGDASDHQGCGLLTFDAARALLGLPPTFTQGEFNGAFRREISKAHPDRGGTDEDAQAIYKARNIIKARRGW